MHRLLALLIVFSSAPAVADPASVCRALIAASDKLSGGQPLKVGSTNITYKGLYDECDRHNTFNGGELPIHKGKRLTCSEHNNVAYLNRFPDRTISFSAKAAVDADGSKFACGAGWPNQCGTWLQFDRGSERKDVNAEDTPFVVVPGAIGEIDFQKDTGIGPGDLAVAFTDKHCSFGVVGDSGPYFRIGEISLRAHKDLDHDRCRHQGEYPCTSIIDLGIDRGVRYLIFPNTRPKPLTSQNVNSISEEQAVDRARKFLEGMR